MTRAERSRIAAMRAQYQRTAELREPNARTATIARLIPQLRASLGREPDAADIASACAMTVTRVRRHLELLGAGGPIS